MAEEALACFENLLARIPGWIAELDEIMASATVRQRQMLLENQTSDNHIPPPSPRRRKPSTTSSLRSHRSDRGMKRSLEMLRPQLPHLTNADALRLEQRNRQTASAVSGDQSGPDTYRSQALIVVYYDGDIQKRFEQLVRTVASSRNDIRKGKMGARVDALARSVSSDSERGGSDGEEVVLPSSKIRLSRPSRAMGSFFGREDIFTHFDRVDDRLEKGQSLCERAAHQILRDGDCAAELLKVRNFFSEGLAIAQEELPGLQRRAEKAVERRRRSEERQKSVDLKRNSATAAAQEAKHDLESAPMVFHASPPGEVARIDADTLEVDDEESDGEFCEYDINTFQMNKISPAMLRRPPPQLRNRYAARAFA